MAVALEDPAVEPGDHIVHFYEHQWELEETVGRYLSHGVLAGGTAIAIATEAHRQAFAAQLGAAGVDLTNAEREGRLILLDAAATLDSFMPEGKIDCDRFHEVIGSVVRHAGENGPPVRAYGEMVALLWDAGDVLAAIELEKLWNELGLELQFSLLCGYHSESVQGSEHAEALREVCQLHSSVLHSSPHEDHRPRHDAEASAQFEATPDAPRHARHFVADMLGRWGHTGAVLEDAQLLATELATNAVVHARSPFSLVARDDDQRVRLSVGDASTVRPTLRAGDPEAISGRGLHLVEALSTSWGVDVTSEGKTVWAELRRDPQAAQ